MRAPTSRQQQVLDFIKDSISERGYAPTIREIGVGLGIRSTNGVNDHLRALERKGYLTREDMKSRTLRPLDLDLGSNDNNAAGNSESSNTDVGNTDASNTDGGFVGNDAVCNSVVDIRILGSVAAGQPAFAEENVIDTISIAPKLVGGSQDVFGLRVKGDSMINAGILDGDYIFVRRQHTANRGDIVVALIADEATVKYFYPEKDYIRLEPANPRIAAILVRASDFRSTMILGVVVGVYRRL
jgi:repressor LexA